MPNPIKGFQTKDGVRKYDYNELENLPETDPDDLALEVEEVKENIEAKKANIDGSYSSMTVGNAEQLVATVGEEDNAPYNFRTSGGNIDIGDRETDKVVGGTICWNQLTDNSVAPTNRSGLTITRNDDGFVVNGTSTQIDSVVGWFRLDTSVIKPRANHVFFVSHTLVSGTVSNAQTVTFKLYSADSRPIRLGGVGIRKAPSTFSIDTVARSSWDFLNKTEFSNAKIRIQVFDLTQMFGSTIADYIYNLETANTGAGVAWFKKLFPKSYYAYNAGELMSVKTSAHKMVGFNAWDEEYEIGGLSMETGGEIANSSYLRSKNFIPVISGATYYRGIGYQSDFRVFYYDADKNYVSSVSMSSTGTFTIPTDIAYIKFHRNGSTYKNDICINLSWDGERDGEYEEYKEHVYPLDSSLELRGIPKLDSANNLYYDGDTYESDGTVTRRCTVATYDGSSDEPWMILTGGGINQYYLNIDNVRHKAGEIDVIANGYTSILMENRSDNYGTVYMGNSVVCFNIDTTVANTVSEWKAYLAEHPVTVIYTSTDVAETAEPYQNPQIVNDFGTEEYVDERAVPIPVGHQTKYLANLRAKLEMAPDSPSADGEYIVKQTNGKNEYIALGSSTTMQSIMAKLPSPPSEDGAYTLKVTVANGTATYSWGE